MKQKSPTKKTISKPIEIYKHKDKKKENLKKEKELKDLNVLSLFSGCGGMDLGFEGKFEVHKDCINQNLHSEWAQKQTKKTWVTLSSTRFKTIFANDIRPGAQKTWNNFFIKNYDAEETSFCLESIVDRVKKHWSGEKHLFPKNVDIVTGGFPCQDFSVAGKRAGFNSHKNHNGSPLKIGLTEENRGQLYMWMREVINIVSPKIFIAENVKGITSLENVKEIIQNDFKEIGKEGYLVVNGQTLHSAEYGIPQSRERVFFIGFRKDLLTKKAIDALSKDEISSDYFPFPQKTHTLVNKKEGNKNLMPFVPLKKVFEDLEEPEKTSDCDQKSFSKAKWYGKHCQGNKEINLNKIGPTIRSEHHGNIEFRRLAKNHGGENLNELQKGLTERRLTIRECCRIQTFPDNYTFIQNKKEQGVSTSEAYKLIGNAVPPLLAYHFAKRLEKLWPILFKKVT